MAADYVKNKLLTNKFLSLVVLSMVCAVFVLLIDLAGLLEPLQLKAYDALFYIRAKTGRTEKVETPIVLVCIDDRTFHDNDFRMPQILWQDHFSTAIRGISQGGARVIGLDYLLPQRTIDDIIPGHSRPWLKTFLMAEKVGPPVVIGNFQLADRVVHPDGKFLQLINPKHIGLVNLTNDSDDFIRRQQLIYPSRDNPEKDIYSVTYLIARIFNPDLKTPDQIIYIDYKSDLSLFTRYSLVDIYRMAKAGDKAGLTKRFDNKIVMIGETDAVTQDRHATPLYYLVGKGNRRTPGVEILAHTVNTILQEKSFTLTPPPVRFIILLILALIVGFFTLYALPQASPRIAIPLVFIIFLACCVLAYNRYYIPPVVGGIAVMLVSLGTMLSYKFWVVDKEKREVRNAFSRYLSPQVVAEVLDKPEMLALGGSRRTLTAFFSDLQGFTSISEALSPEELVNLLNRYLSMMTGAILARDGTLDKFEGDAIMAFWGAPLPQDDHPLRACLAALDQQALLEKFKKDSASENLPELKVRMGINTGPMVVGNMGAQERFDYTIMGDSVNLASRLEGANKAFGTCIMISESTYNEVKDHVEVRELDLLRVKGKKEPIRVFELWAPAGQLDDEKKEVRQAFEEGLSLYRSGNFAQAKQFFKQVLVIDPDDGPAKTFLERIFIFEKDPPPSDWDGVFTMDTK